MFNSDTTERDRRRRRPLSTTPEAIRQRKMRARRKNGLAMFELPLPLKRLEAVVRARENLPANAPVSKQQIHRALAEGIDFWSLPWLLLKRKRVTRDNPR